METVSPRSLGAASVAALVVASLAACSSTPASPSGESSSPGDVDGAAGASGLTYPIVDTGQTSTYGVRSEIDPPAAGEAFAGQDAQVDGYQPSYTDNGDGTVTDHVTGLMWTQSPDLDGDGDIDVDDKLTYDEALGSAGDVGVGGHDDWRVPVSYTHLTLPTT